MQKPTTEAPRWIDIFQFYRLELAGGAININVHPVPPGHRVSINGRFMDGTIADLDEAKQVGIDLARRLMQHATHELDLLRMQTPVKADVPAAVLR